MRRRGSGGAGVAAALKGALRDRHRGGGRAGSAAVTVGGSLTGALCAFAAAIVAARTLSSDQFAVFGVGLAVHSFSSQLADIGLGTVTVTELATGRGSRAGLLAERVRPLAVRRLASAVGFGTGLTLLALAIPALEPYRLAVLVGAAGAVFWSMDQLFVSALQGLRRFHVAAAVLAVIGGLRFVLVAAAAIAAVHGIALLVAYAVVAPALAAPIAGMILMAERRKAAVPAELADPDRQLGSARLTVTPEFRRSAMITYLGGAAVYNFDVLLLALIASQGDVATYSAAWRVAAGASLVNTAIGQAVLPYTIAATDPWREARLLSKAGAMLGATWLVLVPVITLVGVTILGPAGEGAAGPMAILLAAFALDGFCDLTVQIYYRINRAQIAALVSTAELATMMGVTVALQETGAFAPSLGQLGARVVGVLLIATPLVLARLGRLDWFSAGEPGAAERGAFAVEVQSAEERLGL